MTMKKTQSQLSVQGTTDEKKKVWVSCRSKSTMGLAGEGGCGSQEAYVLSTQKTSLGSHVVVYQCVRCGRSFSTSY